MTHVMRDTANYREFSPNQRHALDDARNLAVRANAGSGKTRVLVERIVQQLAASYDAAAPLPLTAFVAITFTRKAAGEIQDRLRAAFQALAARAEPPERAFWLARIDELPRAAIGTIDSFCARLLREFALEGAARIEPDFEPLDEYEAGLLRREAIDRVLNRLSENDADTLTPQEEACRWWGTQQGYDALVHHLDRLLLHQVDAETIVKAHAGLPNAAERVDALWSRLPPVRQLHKDQAELRAAMREIIETIEGLDRPSETLKGCLADATNLLNLLDEEPARERDEGIFEVLFHLLLTKAGKARALRNLNAVADILVPLQETWEDLLGKFSFEPQAEQAALEAADRLALVLGEVAAEFAGLCRLANRYDFTTLARQARTLLADSAEVRKALRERYRHVLVDEFQDTNQLQWEIVSRVVGKEENQPLPPGRLFVVGDPQQSIYRFRDADVGVFTHVQELIRAGNAAHGLAEVPTCHDRASGASLSTPEQRLGLMPLGANYRSLSPLPLGLVDRVFQYVFDHDRHGLEPEHNRFEVTYQQLEAGTNNPAVGEVRYVLPEELPGDSEGADADASGEDDENAADTLSQLQVAALVDQLVSLHGAPKHTAKPGEPNTLAWADMAVLLPSRTTVLLQLEEELRARGVPFAVTGGIGFWQRQEVSDIINLACCLADRGDELSLFAVLRGPLGQLVDADILFLSQLGLGSLERGLRQVRLGGADLLTAPVEGDAAWLRDRWQRLPVEVRAVLLAYWNDLSDGRRTRLRETAALLDGWRKRVDRMAHADLLQRALEEAGSFALYAAGPDGDRALANLMRCFDQVRHLETRAALDLNRLARRLRELRDSVPREEQATLARGDAVQIMTVHAAKGLEFPVVAVMKMDRKAAGYSYAGLLVTNPADQLLPGAAETFAGLNDGTLAVRLRHPERPREVYRPLLLLALQELDRAQQLAESRRLFYVAATRAQERLILVGKDPGLNKSGAPAYLPESWQLWFERALDITPDHKKLGLWSDPASGQQVTIVRQAAGLQPPAAPVPAATVAYVDLAYLHERPLHPVVATTSLEKMRELWHEDPHAYWLRYRVQLQPQVPRAGNVFNGTADNTGLGTVIGSMVHRCLELPVTALETEADELRPLLTALAGNLLAAGGVDDGEDAAPGHAAEIDTAVTVALRILDRLRHHPERAKAIRNLVTAAGDAEVPFGLRLGNWFISGRFDKLLRLDDGWEVIDWKTDGDEDAEVIVARHTPQMRLYALALHRAGLAALAEGVIRVHLALLGPVQVRTLTFTVAELETFAAELEQELAAMSATGA